MSCPFRYKDILTKELLYQLYVVENKSIPDISNIVNISMSTIRLYLISYNIKLRTHKKAANLIRHKLGNGMRGKKRIFTQEHKDNMKASKLKYSEQFAKGFTLKQSGYYEITKGKNKFKRVHDVVYEECTGIKLNKGEVIHHRNLIKTDNRIENLKLMTSSEHSRLHLKLRRLKNNNFNK